MEFFGLPNKLLLINDIEKIKNKYYDKNTSKKPETIKSIITDLIIDLTNEKENAIKYYNTSVTLYQLHSKSIITEIRNLLTNHGWYWWEMRFTTPPNRELLVEDIQKLLDKHDKDCLSNYINAILGNEDKSNYSFPRNINDIDGSKYSTVNNSSKSNLKYNNVYDSVKNNTKYNNDYDSDYNKIFLAKSKKLESNHPVTKAVVTLFESLFEGNLESKFTNCIAKFCETVDNNYFHDEEIVVNISNVLEKHLWNWDSKKGPRGFYTEPNRGILIADIQDIMDNYEIVCIKDDELKDELIEGDIMPKSSSRKKLDPDDLLYETINNLVTELYSSISTNAPVNKYYEMIEIMSHQKEAVVLEINKILVKYGWITLMRKFHVEPERDLLICDIQDVVEKYT